MLSSSFFWENFATVSYTHLDVYKRQIVTNGDDMGELKMLAEGYVLAGTPLFKF